MFRAFARLHAGWSMMFCVPNAVCHWLPGAHLERHEGEVASSQVRDSPQDVKPATDIAFMNALASGKESIEGTIFCF